MAIALFLLSIIATVSLLAWLYILLHPARPWDFQPVGDDDPPPALPDGAAFPAVTVIVPARNEAESLPNTLPALLDQDYPGDYRIIIVDDRSTDGTAELAMKLAADRGKSERVTVLRGEPLPAGWMGKVWAMTQGAKAAAAHKPQFVLLTDADIRHEPTSLRRLVSESTLMKLGMNSRMARLRCQSPPEKLLIPAFVYFFNLLYPMRRVNRPDDPLAGAAGGCVLLSWEAIEKLGGGFESIKSEIIDDVNLARQVKSRGLPIRLSLSRNEVVSLREYPELADIWKMVRRTAFTELKYSWLRLAGALAGLVLMFVVPVIAIWAGILGLVISPGVEGLVFTAAAAIVKGFLALAIMRSVYAPAVRFFELPSGYAWSLPMAGVLYGMMTFDSACCHAQGKGPQWRDAGTAAAGKPDVKSA